MGYRLDEQVECIRSEWNRLYFKKDEPPRNLPLDEDHSRGGEGEPGVEVFPGKMGWINNHGAD
jgi:hypothetical protein